MKKNEEIKNMNRYYKLISIIIVLASLFMLCSCDMVYNSGISGTVTDSAGNAIDGVKVYAYTSESEWNEKYNSYVKGSEKNVFDDKYCSFKATTASNGVFNITPFVWKTSNSPWGKDYASCNVYLIFFSKDYGIVKEGPFTVMSDSAGDIGQDISMGNKITETDILTLDFVANGTSNKIDGAATFDYFYNDGYDDIKGTLSITNGSATINVKRFKDSAEPTKVTISNIKSTRDVWVPEDANNKVFDVESNKHEDISMKRQYWYFENGISGKVIAPKLDNNVPAIGSYSAKVEFEGVDGTYPTVSVVDNTQTSGEFVSRQDGSYSGLASNVLIPVGDKTQLVITVTVGTESGNFTDGKSETKTLKLTDTTSNITMNVVDMRK